MRADDFAIREATDMGMPYTVFLDTVMPHFVAGASAIHKPVVMQLVSELGFEAVDAGPLRAARLLEPLAMLWIELALKRGQGREFAFAMIRRHPFPNLPE